MFIKQLFSSFTEDSAILLSIKTPTLKYETLEITRIRNAHPDLF